MIARNPAVIAAIAAAVALHGMGVINFFEAGSTLLQAVDKSMQAVVDIPKLVPQVKATIHGKTASNSGVLQQTQPAAKADIGIANQ